MNQASANVEQQWQQARTLLSAGKISESLAYLETAAQALHPAACFNLGIVHLFSLSNPVDKNRGIALVKQAAKLGHGGAYYQLAMLELSKPAKEPDWQYANECLRKSAELAHPTALRSLAIHWSRSSNSEILALSTLCLEHAAMAGDIVSLALLMQRLLDGFGCEKNTLRASAINTLLVQTALPIDPPTASADPHFAQPANLPDLPELPAPALENDLWLPELQMISESPWIGIAESVLTEEECNLVRYIGGPHLKPSVTATPDGQRVQLQLRTSFDMVFEEMLEDISLMLIQRRMAAAVDTTPAYSEYMQLLRYQNAQEYRPHRDYLPPGLITPLEQGGAGQRESTVIVYLNNVADGGETEFIELGRKITPKAGRILAFKNLRADGTPDTATLHAGLPVNDGTKWISTLWIHQGVFRK